MSWEKSDGAAIKITFDKALTSDVSGNQSHFTVIAKEYNWVPNGTLQDVTKTALSTAVGETAKEVILIMADLTRFESAVELTVAYDGLGTLSGDSGAVEAFSVTFTPTELAPKPDQNDEEHIEISSITATGTLTEIQHKDAQVGGEHLEIVGITATGTLTHVDNI